MGACVGDDPPPSNDGRSEPCIGAACEDGGADPGRNDAGPSDADTSSDAQRDSLPAACTRIQVTTLAGSSEGNTDGPGSDAKFARPQGLAVDAATGTLYVADTGNASVRKVLSDGTTSTYSTSAAGGWDTPVHASYPSAFNTLYISEARHDQVFRVNTNGTSASDFALGSMAAFAVQPETFRKFVVSTTRVAQWIPGGGVIEATVFSGTFDVGFVDGAAADARYGALKDLTFDGPETLYVADRGNHRIRVVNAKEGPTYGDVTTLAGSSTAGHLDGVGEAAQFEGPNAFALDEATHLLYVADGATIRVVTSSGEVSTLVGSTSAFVDGDGCDAKFINAIGIAKFANELYVLDVNRIRKIVME